MVFFAVQEAQKQSQLQQHAQQSREKHIFGALKAQCDEDLVTYTVENSGLQMFKAPFLFEEKVESGWQNFPSIASINNSCREVCVFLKNLFF